MKAYIDYLRRCQYLLQQGPLRGGHSVFLRGRRANTLPEKGHILPALPDGYSYDGCDAETLLTRVDVRDGRLVLPHGMEYRVLVLKDTPTMTPELLRKITGLVKAGATVIGPRPLKSPSLRDYPRCDAEVRRLADALWGSIDGEATTERTLGAGRIVWGPSVGEVLEAMGVGVDVDISQRTGTGPIEWLHRRSGEADITSSRISRTSSTMACRRRSGNGVTTHSPGTNWRPIRRPWSWPSA